MKLSKIRISARHSDLARLQAYRVGDAIKAAHPDVEIQYAFRASLGDQNLSDPLWKMPEKGVFTEDFVKDLEDDKADLVVHSWKDLPTEMRPGLTIACTLPRADQRDLFIFKKSSGKPARLRILTSSPRRAYNLDPFFRSYLSWPIDDVVFENVRGNIPTRLKKLLSGDADGLILAKAAVDRLLEAPEPEFADARATISEALRSTRHMILPLALNPTAAAQGALAVEIRAERTELAELLAPIHCAETFASVVHERQILSSHGGGCHQKIGISILDRSFGRLTYMRGLTDAGLTLNEASLTSHRPIPKSISPDAIFPRAGEESTFFERSFLPRASWSEAEDAPFIIVARETAWPDDFRAQDHAVIWSAGLKTWQKLASRGVWVSGSSESLGEAEHLKYTTIATATTGQRPEWIKLTHDKASSNVNLPTDPQKVVQAVATYQLNASLTPPDLSTRTHFYWMSGTAFDRAVEIDPNLPSRGFHASGPGHTHDHLKKKLPRGSTAFIYLNVDQFRRAVLPGAPA